MNKLRKAENELFENIESLSMSIKSQENTIAKWDENNVLLLDKQIFTDSMINDMDRLAMLKESYCKLLDQMKQEIFKM